MNWRRLLFWVVVIGAVLWVGSNPSRAGQQVAHIINLCLIGIESVFTAISTAFNGIK